MTGRVEYLKDVLGNNYLGISVYPTEINPFLDKLKNIHLNITIFIICLSI
jgi:hypothetical protein